MLIEKQIFSQVVSPPPHHADIEFRACVFRDVALTHWQFANCRFVDCLFENCQAPRAKFENAVFLRCRFTNSNLRKIELRQALFDGCAFSQGGFSRAYFGQGVKFVRCDFDDVSFEMGYAEPFRIESCSFARLPMNLNGPLKQIWSLGNVMPFALLLAQGLETCIDRDGSLGGAIGKLYLSLDDIEPLVETGVSPEHAMARSRDNVRRAFSALYASVKSPTSSEERELKVVADISAQLIQRVGRDHKALHQITPREFEQLVAGLMAEMSWEVELTGCTRDGGYDIFAVKHDVAGIRSTLLIECKRYAPERKVDLAIVRNLWTLRGDERRGGCMVATTSTFSADAIKYQKSRYELELADHERILDWCRRYAQP